MRILMCIALTVVANAAQAQLRLPVAPLPTLPIQKLTQTVGQAGAGTLEQLSEVRQLLVANLIRANPIVRGELLAYSPSTGAIKAAQADGFRITREQSSGDLDIRLVVLQAP